MEPTPESGFLTFGLAGRLYELGVQHEWLERATSWCWARIDRDGEVGGYTVKYALDFLDAVPDSDRADAAMERLRPAFAADGTVAVSDGIEGEKLTPLQLSARTGLRSRRLLSEPLIDADLDRLQHEQRDDGGWDFDFLHWSPAQELEWRGIVTLAALRTLRAHRRL